jgi:hypothetical protein
MQRITMMLALFALCVAGCAMATASDNVVLLEMETDSYLHDDARFDMLGVEEAMGEPWLCGGTMGELRTGIINCPQFAPVAVTWRVTRADGLVIAAGTGLLLPEGGRIGHDGFWVLYQ